MLPNGLCKAENKDSEMVSAEVQGGPDHEEREAQSPTGSKGTHQRFGAERGDAVSLPPDPLEPARGEAPLRDVWREGDEAPQQEDDRALLCRSGWKGDAVRARSHAAEDGHGARREQEVHQEAEAENQARRRRRRRTSTMRDQDKGHMIKGT
ncbi:unnamed protein product [Prorocentrum cordatum]|uniref:Uncharacterized protein n=1 Tax=Prorocentrum cordatum TaxID=2364126 RepID=A0ABN9QKF1_9DINO|nr:unnamed protein product [Polarella glacialis]